MKDPLLNHSASALRPTGDYDIRRAFDHVNQSLAQSAPFSSWQIVQVTFNSTANADTIIPHDLDPANVEAILWDVKAVEFPAAPTTIPIIYRDGASGRRPWAKTYIVLRCNVASLTATLLIGESRRPITIVSI